MPLTIDARGIEKYASLAQAAGLHALVLQVSSSAVTDSVMAELAVSLGSTPPADHSGAVWAYRAPRGVNVWLRDASTWQSTAGLIANLLNELGARGSIRAPTALDVTPIALGAGSGVPTLQMGLRQECLLRELPANEHGVAEFRWNVSAPVTERLLAARVGWVVSAEHPSEVTGAGPTVPVDPSSVRQVLEETMPYARQNLTVHSLLSDSEYRSLTMAVWGQASLVEVDLSRPLDCLPGYISAVTELASDLDVACVATTTPIMPTWVDVRGGSGWLLHDRDAWSERVADAQGIQLLTSAHLKCAWSLSNWTVDEVASDRWLVQWPDLQQWYRDGHPPPELHAQARADFGSMIWRNDEA